MTYLIILVLAVSIVSLFYAASVAWLYLVDAQYFRDALHNARPVAITVAITVTALVILVFILSIFLPF